MPLQTFPARVLDRQLIGGRSESIAALADDLVAQREHFVLFLAADTHALPGAVLVAAAEAAIRAGTSYVCCWGPDCSRFHDAFDEADLLVNGESSEERVLMSTWHEDESLEQALWFAVHLAQPSGFYEATTRTVLAVAIDNPGWAGRITAYLAAGAPFLDEA